MAKAIGLIIVIIALYMTARCDQQQAFKRSRTETSTEGGR